MISSLYGVGAAGVVCGLFLRIPGVIFATAVVVAIAVAFAIAGQASLGSIMVSVLLHVAVLQAAYLTTLLVVSLWIRSR